MIPLEGKGRWLVLEGIDGSGTTTQAERLAERAEAMGIDTLLTAEPSQGPIGKMAREGLRRDSPMAPDALALLFAADRLDHVRREVLPALQAGKLVICDRYLVSSWAYQGLDFPLEWVKEINSYAPHPHLTLFFDVSAMDAAERRLQRGEATERFERDALQLRLEVAYRKLADQYPAPHLRIDASLDIEGVHAQCWAGVDPWLEALTTP